MLTTKVAELIERQADVLARAAAENLVASPRTRSLQRIPPDELEAWVRATYRQLGSWIGNPRDDSALADHESWGTRRCRDGLALSVIVYSLIAVKHRLRQLVRDHGLVEFSGDRVVPGGVDPVPQHGIHELNFMVGEFFDRAMHDVARGYEKETARPPVSASG
jgi:hypothetical protein